MTTCSTQELPPGGQCTLTVEAMLSQKSGSQLASIAVVAGASPTSAAALRGSEPRATRRKQVGSKGRAGRW